MDEFFIGSGQYTGVDASIDWHIGARIACQPMASASTRKMPSGVITWSKLLVDLIIFIFKIKWLGVFQVRLVTIRPISASGYEIPLGRHLR